MNRIKILRLVNNKTQKDLAKYLNVSKQAIFYYEQGKRNPKPGKQKR
ncbi:helix-turn-helix transcriptional regulator [Lactobacillus johnsonii]